MTPVRLTFLTVIPSPYMRDLFEAFQRDPRFRLRVKYLEREAVAAPGVYWKDRPLPDYATVLPGGSFQFWRARVHVNSRVVRSLREDKPDVVVVAGYNALSAQIAMSWLRFTRIPWIFWGEVPGYENRSHLARALRWLAQRPAVRFSSAVAAIGSRAARIYRDMTTPRRPVWNIPYCCDLAPFRSDRSRDAAAGPRFLYCGQLVPRKGVDLLVRAFVRVADRHPLATLTLVGGGPMQRELESLVPAAVGRRLRFAGFREVEELPAIFAESDVFVLPSRHDGWGVVVNQAVGAGLPVIASSSVGAAEDLVRNGDNGIVFPSGNEEALAQALHMFAARPELIARYGERSLAAANQVEPARIVDRWYDLCQTVVARTDSRVPDRITL